MIDIRQEVHQNFIDYAYEANSQRAFPAAVDGLKPGQRACLFEFYRRGYLPNKPHVKSAKISGGVIAELWPHGDTAIYETFTRMSQPWLNNVPEVDWHGQNGNQIIGPEAASQRYTEARLSKVAEEGMFSGFKKNNVPMIPNFSEDLMMPEYLPAVLPRLLLNGSQGIGVTIANHWTLFNLAEAAELIQKYVKENILDYENFYPDYPTGGIIINGKDIHKIHETGKGKVLLRGKTEIKDNKILITELPYQVYVEPFIDKIKTLIQKEEIKGINDILNKSSKTGILIEIQCGDDPQKILNKLFLTTDLQKSLNPNQFALVGKTPKLLNLKQYLDLYIEHNLKCIKKEFEFDLRKAESRKEIVEGLVKALEDIDNIIELIKKSENSKDAMKKLCEKYKFTENQSKAIVGMKLGSLAKLESVELNDELKGLIKTIKKCNNIMSNQISLKEIFLERLLSLSKKYGTKRKTEVTNIDVSKLKEEKEIVEVEPEECVVLITESGLIKRIPSKSFKTQKRNGKGVKSQDDITSKVIRTNTVDNLMVFTTKGKMYKILVENIPEGTNRSQGVSISSLIELEYDEKVSTIYSLYHDTKEKYICIATKRGMIKKTELAEFNKTKKKTGISAIKLKENDEVCNVFLMTDEDIIVSTRKGYTIHFASGEVRVVGKTAQGVKSIKLEENDEIVSVLPIRNKEDYYAVFYKNGNARKSKLSEYPTQGRGGKGVRNAKDAEIAAAALVDNNDKILVCGNMSNICINASDISEQYRTAFGVKILNTGFIVEISKI